MGNELKLFIWIVQIHPQKLKGQVNMATVNQKNWGNNFQHEKHSSNTSTLHEHTKEVRVTERESETETRVVFCRGRHELYLLSHSYVPKRDFITFTTENIGHFSG